MSPPPPPAAFSGLPRRCRRPHPRAQSASLNGAGLQAQRQSLGPRAPAPPPTRWPGRAGLGITAQRPTSTMEQFFTMKPADSDVNADRRSGEIPDRQGSTAAGPGRRPLLGLACTTPRQGRTAPGGGGERGPAVAAAAAAAPLYRMILSCRISSTGRRRFRCRRRRRSLG